MTNAEEVAKQTGIVYKPGTKFAVRAVGYAQMKNGICRIVVENGSPRLAAIETMVHELTHIWQYLNWKDREKAWNLKMEKKAYTAAAGIFCMKEWKSGYLSSICIRWENPVMLPVWNRFRWLGMMPEEPDLGFMQHNIHWLRI